MCKIDEAIKFEEDRHHSECSSEIFHKRKNVIECLKYNKKLEKENIELKETIKGLREEGEEYDKKLNRIDELALLIENATKRIRNNI